MHHHAVIDDAERTREPDTACLIHGVFYVTVHGPGSWIAHHPYANRPILVGLTDTEGRDLSGELPEALAPSDDEDEDGSILLLRTNGHLRYPLTLRIVPA